MKKLIILLVAVVSFTACENEIDEDVVAEVDNVEFSQKTTSKTTTLQIVEGLGLGDVVTLGMSRGEIIDIATNGNCDSANECSFRLTPETGVITVTFNSNNLVTSININQSGLSDEDKWTTTQGAADEMLPEDVAALYPGSVITSSYPYTYVDAPEYGYRYSYYRTCSYFGCTTLTTHTVFPAITGEGQREFIGDIIINNPARKTKTYSIILEITDPKNKVISIEPFSLNIQGQGSISIDPGTFVDINGPVGIYTYKAILYNKKGREKGISSGTFQIVIN